MKQQYIDKIRDLSKDLTDKDRTDAKETLGISEFTLNRYLSGDVRKFDLADRLIEFLEARPVAQN